LDADGWEMESDFYLKLGSDISEILRGHTHLTPSQPRYGTKNCDGTNWVEVSADQCKPSCGSIGGRVQNLFLDF